MFTRKTLTADRFNEFVKCQLCNGYLVDCVKIDECLHNFCKSCILKYMQQNNKCPICKIEINNLKPWANLRSDVALQSIVNRMLPHTVLEEIRRQAKYYQFDTSGSNQIKSIETTYRRIIEGAQKERNALTEHGTVCIQLKPSVSAEDKEGKVDLIHHAKEKQNTKKKNEGAQEGDSSADTLYVRVSSFIPMGVLEKFVRLKLLLDTSAKITFYAISADKHLVWIPESLSILDVVQSICWQEDDVLPLRFSILGDTNSITRNEIKWVEIEKSLHINKGSNSNCDEANRKSGFSVIASLENDCSNRRTFKKKVRGGRRANKSIAVNKTGKRSTTGHEKSKARKDDDNMGDLSFTNDPFISDHSQANTSRRKSNVSGKGQLQACEDPSYTLTSISEKNCPQPMKLADPHQSPLRMSTSPLPTSSVPTSYLNNEPVIPVLGNSIGNTYPNMQATSSPEPIHHSFVLDPAISDRCLNQFNHPQTTSLRFPLAASPFQPQFKLQQPIYIYLSSPSPMNLSKPSPSILGGMTVPTNLATMSFFNSPQNVQPFPMISPVLCSTNSPGTNTSTDSQLSSASTNHNCCNPLQLVGPTTSRDNHKSPQTVPFVFPTGFNAELFGQPAGPCSFFGNRATHDAIPLSPQCQQKLQSPVPFRFPFPQGQSPAFSNQQCPGAKLGHRGRLGRPPRSSKKSVHYPNANCSSAATSSRKNSKKKRSSSFSTARVIPVIASPMKKYPTIMPRKSPCHGNSIRDMIIAREEAERRFNKSKSIRREYRFKVRRERPLGDMMAHRIRIISHSVKTINPSSDSRNMTDEKCTKDHSNLINVGGQIMSSPQVSPLLPSILQDNTIEQACERLLRELTVQIHRFVEFNR